MTRSKCCKAIVYIYKADEGNHCYVCSECDRACDVVREEAMSKSDCCGADIKLGSTGQPTCIECGGDCFVYFIPMPEEEK